MQITNGLGFNTSTGTNSSNLLDDPDSVSYPDFDPSRKYVYRLHFNIFRDNNGVRVNGDVGEAEVMNIVRDLNLSFNQFNIFFKYIGFDYVDNTSLTGDFFVNNLMPTYG